MPAIPFVSSIWSVHSSKKLSAEPGRAHISASSSMTRRCLFNFVPSESVVSVRNRIGVLEPLYCTAIGKAILASLPDEDRGALLDTVDLVPRTPRTISDRDMLRRHIAAVRADGVAVDDGEFNELLVCVAACVVTPEGMPRLSIGVSALRPVVVADARILPAVTRELKAIARDLEVTLCRGSAANQPSRRAGRQLARQIEP